MFLKRGFYLKGIELPSGMNECIVEWLMLKLSRRIEIVKMCKKSNEFNAYISLISNDKKAKKSCEHQAFLSLPEKPWRIFFSVLRKVSNPINPKSPLLLFGVRKIRENKNLVDPELSKMLQLSFIILLLVSITHTILKKMKTRDRAFKTKPQTIVLPTTV